MTTKAEEVLLALLALLEAAAPAGVAVQRNTVLPERVASRPDDATRWGLVILRDGDPGEPEVTLSPTTWEYDHVAEVEVFAQAGERDARFDDIKAAIGVAIAADRTLGGLCSWVEAVAPAPLDLPVEGAHGIKAAVIGVRLSYTTTDPLS